MSGTTKKQLGLYVSTRQEIQRQLKQDTFTISGANGTVKFLPSGDRSLETALVTVKANPERGYYFELIENQR